MAKGEGTRTDEQSVDLDQYAKDAIDEVFSKEQQSYDEFVQGFMFLTKDDVTGMTAQSSHSCHADSIIQNGTTSHDMNLKASNDVTLQNSLLQKSQETENDNIPEEVLGPGSAAVPILMRTAPSGAILQVDNFVDCEDELSDDNDDDGEEEDKKKLHSFLEDEILSSNYSPSVLAISNSPKNQEVEESRINDSDHKVDLDDERLKAAKELEICYLSDVSTLPGEVDDYETAEKQDTSCACEAVVSPNIRQLQISTRINNCDKRNDDQNNLSEEHVGSDEVQPFTLDTDFDYDDVTLTPKFSFVPKHTL